HQPHRLSRRNRKGNPVHRTERGEIRAEFGLEVSHLQERCHRHYAPNLTMWRDFDAAPPVRHAVLAYLRVARNWLWSDHMNRKLLRSCVVGAGATVVDLGALWLMVNVFEWPATVANVPALLLGVVAQFVGAKLFAFECRSPHVMRQGGQFLLVEAGALVLNAIIFHILVTATPIPYPVARLVGSSAVYFGYSYPLWRRIFTQRQGG